MSRPQYQSQLDSIAGGLVNAFAETNTGTGAQAARPVHLFRRDLGSRLDAGFRPRRRNHGVFRRRLRNPSLIQNGGINGSAYVQNTTGAAGYNTLINNDMSALSATTTFPVAARGFRPRTA